MPLSSEPRDNSLYHVTDGSNPISQLREFPAMRNRDSFKSYKYSKSLENRILHTNGSRSDKSIERLRCRISTNCELPRYEFLNQSEVCNCLLSADENHLNDPKFTLKNYLRNTRFQLDKHPVTKFQKLKLKIKISPKTFCSAKHISSLTHLPKTEFIIRVVKDDQSKDIKATTENGHLCCEFIPVTSGLHKVELLELTHDSCAQNRLYVDFFTVKQLNPSFSFNHANACPVSIATSRGVVYVAYIDHVCSFSTSGKLKSVLIGLEDRYINDLAVNEHVIALAISGWNSEDENTYRFQEIRIYDTSGKHMDTFSGNPAMFVNPVLRVAISSDGKVLIPDKESIHVYDPSEKQLLGNKKYRNFLLNFASKVHTFNNHVYILDSTQNCLIIFDNNFEFSKTIKLCNASSPIESNSELVMSNGTTSSFCIDSQNDVIMVSNCVTGYISVYRLGNGEYLGAWTNTWSPLRWPLDLCICDITSTLYVLDHGNKCVFAYTRP